MTPETLFAGDRHRDDSCRSDRCTLKALKDRDADDERMTGVKHLLHADGIARDCE